MKATHQTKNCRKRGAFTLVEMLIVLTIIVILAGSGIFLVTGFVDDAKVTRVENDLKALDLAIGGYMRNNYDRPPTQEQGLAALTTRPTSEPIPKKWRAYLKEEMLDPWGNPYQFRIPAQKSKEKYDIWSNGEDGQESEDDIGNW